MPYAWNDFIQYCFNQSLRSLLQEGKWWGKEQRAKGWFCFVLLFLLNFLLKTVLWEWVCPWQRRDEHPTGSIRHFSAKICTQWWAEPLRSQPAAAVAEQRSEGLWKYEAPLQCMSFQNQSHRLGKASTQLTPDLWCWGKRTLILSTVAGLTFA